MRKALGKGLEALFPATPAAPPAPGERLVAVEDIVSNPDQPRRHFDEETLAALADSIRPSRRASRVKSPWPGCRSAKQRAGLPLAGHARAAPDRYPRRPTSTCVPSPRS